MNTGNCSHVTDILRGIPQTIPWGVPRALFKLLRKVPSGRIRGIPQGVPQSIPWAVPE